MGALFHGASHHVASGYSPGAAEEPTPGLALPPMELAVTTSLRTIDLAGASFSGWSAHPLLANYFYGASTATGERFGLGRATFAGGAARLQWLLGDHVSLGGRFGAWAQTSRNLAAPDSDGAMRATRGWLLEGGLDTSAILPLGNVTLRGGVFVGYRVVSASIEGIGLAGCTSVPVAHAGAFTVAPQVEVDVNVTRHVSIGAVASVDALQLDDYQAGLNLAWHARAYAGR